MGEGAGTGFTVNLRLPGGTGDREYARLYREIVGPIASAFAPELVLVSVGFDPHALDPLAGMALTERGFGELTDVCLGVADWSSRSRAVFGGHMVEHGYGRIVNIASLASFVALLDVAAYVASKAAVAALTKSLAVEWAPRGVCVNAIAPGVFPTELNQALLDGTPRGQEFSPAHADEALWPHRRAGGGGGVLVRGGELRGRRDPGRGNQ